MGIIIIVGLAINTTVAMIVMIKHHRTKLKLENTETTLYEISEMLRSADYKLQTTDVEIMKLVRRMTDILTPRAYTVLSKSADTDHETTVDYGTAYNPQPDREEMLRWKDKLEQLVN